MEECAETLVLRFVTTRSGTLRCRVTDVNSQKTWIAANARLLRELVHDRAVSDTHGNPAKR